MELNKTVNIEDFNINMEEIPLDVFILSKRLSKSREKFLSKRSGTGYNFLVLLYYLRFVEKLENSEIAEKLKSKNVETIHFILYDLGWEYSKDYAENKILFQKNLDESRLKLAEAKTESLSIDVDQNEKLKSAIEKAKRQKTKVYEKLGFKSGEEYARVFYYLKYVKDMPPKKFIHLFDLTLSVVQVRLENLGLNESYNEAMKGKKERKSQDYSKSLNAGRKKRVNAQFENFSPTASSNEEYFRQQLSNFIYENFDITKYEIIIGVTNTKILAPLEIDIPVVIFNLENRKIHRFAIEYNGVYYHSKKRDLQKESKATQKGWHYLEVNDLPRYSNSRELFDRKIVSSQKLGG